VKNQVMLLARSIFGCRARQHRFPMLHSFLSFILLPRTINDFTVLALPYGGRIACGYGRFAKIIYKIAKHELLVLVDWGFKALTLGWRNDV
jgi:hypothetical protein